MGNTNNLLVIAGSMLVGIALIASAITRVRKKLAVEAKPTLGTYLNELGGYVVVGVILILISLAVIVSSIVRN